MRCSHEHFLANLIEANKKAQAEPEVIELIAAYARLCLKESRDVNFYEKSSSPATNKITVKTFIDKNRHLDKRILSFLTSYAEMMRSRELPFFFNTAHLADFLDLEPEKLKKLIADKDGCYHRFHIPKRNGGSRIISAPTRDLKSIQRTILGSILERVPLHPSANGFRRNKSILTNAENHTGREVVIKIDLKDFFPSITYQRAKGVYLNLGYPEGVANALAELSTHKGRLPMGAPTSPYLSNIVASRLDRRFTNLGNKMNFAYSRYADDLAFSSQDEKFAGNIAYFKKIIHDEGFGVNERKVVIARKGGQQKITGVVVNRKVNVDRSEYRRLRAIVHNCLRSDPTEEMRKWGVLGLGEFKSALSGHINFVKMVNEEKGQRLLEQFQKISWSS
jgi:RNA-directed DNA polymerase